MNFEVSFKSVQDWATGGNGEITIVNKGDTQTDWSFNLTTSNFTIDDSFTLL